jgi:hypothetical protein
VNLNLNRYHHHRHHRPTSRFASVPAVHLPLVFNASQSITLKERVIAAMGNPYRPAMDYLSRYGEMRALFENGDYIGLKIVESTDR